MVQLRRAKWFSMLDLKAGFYSIPFKSASSYDSIFSHQGKFQWLKMPMCLR